MELKEWLERQVKMCENKVIFWDGSRQGYANVLKALQEPQPAAGGESVEKPDGNADHDNPA